MIVLICGLPGTGKTTLAKHIAPLIDAVILSSDKIRKELFPTPTYSREEREFVYQVMLLLAKYLHSAQKNCILDATFTREKSRVDALRAIGISMDEFFVVECHCPEFLVKTRLSLRKDDFSDADILTYYKMRKIYESTKMTHIDVDTSDTPSKNAESVIRKIYGTTTTTGSCYSGS